MLRRMLLLTLVLATANAADWTPPASPDAHAILDQARVDRRAGRYDIALAKHIWYHENALALDAAQSGVRLSYALADWNKLGKEFPPALVKLLEFRDRARTSVLAGVDTRQSFMDLDAINRELGQRTATADLFRELDRRNPAAAAQVYSLAGASLVMQGDYALFAKYLNPPADYSRALSTFKLEQTIPFVDRKTSGQLFTSKVTTLVAVLAVTGRLREAQDIAANARKDWEDDVFSAELDRALSGQVPPPFP